MRTYLSSTIFVAAAAAAGLTLSACSGPMWYSSHGEMHEHVGEEANARAAADTETNVRVTSVDEAAKDALARANVAGEAAKHPFLHSVLMKDDSIVFDTNKADLSPEDQATLTSLAEKLKAENQNVYIEIQGHGDTRGSVAHNNQLGQQRADAVRQFLAQQGVPLDRMSTVSYGELNPKNPENTPEANAENRRAVVIVML